MRYILMLCLNLPLVLLAFLNLIVKFKTKKIDARQMKRQVLIWSFILVVLVASFPIYNLTNGRSILDAHELSMFDIVEVTAIIYLISYTYGLRHKLNETEGRLEKMHRELSITIMKDVEK